MHGHTILLLQAQPSLQQLFQLLPRVWKLQTLLTAHPDQADILDLTIEDSAAKHTQRASVHHLKSDMLWVSTALEWGPLCPQATVMHWAEAMLQVSIKACTAGLKQQACIAWLQLGCADSATLGA